MHRRRFLLRVFTPVRRDGSVLASIRQQLISQFCPPSIIFRGVKFYRSFSTCQQLTSVDVEVNKSAGTRRSRSLKVSRRNLGRTLTTSEAPIYGRSVPLWSRARLCIHTYIHTSSKRDPQSRNKTLPERDESAILTDSSRWLLQRE